MAALLPSAGRAAEPRQFLQVTAENVESLEGLGLQPFLEIDKVAWTVDPKGVPVINVYAWPRLQVPGGGKSLPFGRVVDGWMLRLRVKGQAFSHEEYGQAEPVHFIWQYSTQKIRNADRLTGDFKKALQKRFEGRQVIIPADAQKLFKREDSSPATLLVRTPGQVVLDELGKASAELGYENNYVLRQKQITLLPPNKAGLVPKDARVALKWEGRPEVVGGPPATERFSPGEFIVPLEGLDAAALARPVKLSVFYKGFGPAAKTYENIYRIPAELALDELKPDTGAPATGESERTSGTPASPSTKKRVKLEPADPEANMAIFIERPGAAPMAIPREPGAESYTFNLADLPGVHTRPVRLTVTVGEAKYFKGFTNVSKIPDIIRLEELVREGAPASPAVTTKPAPELPAEVTVLFYKGEGEAMERKLLVPGVRFAPVDPETGEPMASLAVVANDFGFATLKLPPSVSSIAIGETGRPPDEKKMVWSDPLPLTGALTPLDHGAAAFHPEVEAIFTVAPVAAKNPARFTGQKVKVSIISATGKVYVEETLTLGGKGLDLTLANYPIKTRTPRPVIRGPIEFRVEPLEEGIFAPLPPGKYRYASLAAFKEALPKRGRLDLMLNAAGSLENRGLLILMDAARSWAAFGDAKSTVNEYLETLLQNAPPGLNNIGCGYLGDDKFLFPEITDATRTRAALASFRERINNLGSMWQPQQLTEIVAILAGIAVPDSTSAEKAPAWREASGKVDLCDIVVLIPKNESWVDAGYTAKDAERFRGYLETAGIRLHLVEIGGFSPMQAYQSLQGKEGELYADRFTYRQLPAGAPREELAGVLHAILAPAEPPAGEAAGTDAGSPGWAAKLKAPARTP